MSLPQISDDNTSIIVDSVDSTKETDVSPAPVLQNANQQDSSIQAPNSSSGADMIQANSSEENASPQ